MQKAVDISRVPSEVPLKISADSKYWLWINGEPVVIEGGVKRGPNRTDSYYDSINVAQYLHKGENIISAQVWYYGKPGFSYNPSGQGALFIDSPRLSALNTDSTWVGMVHPAYYLTDGTQPNYRLPESNLGFDARKDIGEWQNHLNQWPAVKAVGYEGDEPWGALHHRVIPMWKDYGLTRYVSTTLLEGEEFDTLRCRLPYNCHAMPYIAVTAPEGLKIDIITDDYFGGNAPSIRAEYITKEGPQEYENKGWMNGHDVNYIFPHKSMTINKVAFRETGYDTDFAGSFECNDPFFNKLWEKAARTLYVTMRDTYMDCPDRERAQWWGDEVNESGESFYALSRSADALMRKGMYELIAWQRPDSTIYAPVPSSNYENHELPGQMLASVGYYGFYNYYLNTGDLKPIADLYPGVKKYMAIWKQLPDGTIEERTGGWHWGDWGENIDKAALYNAFYYLAQKGQREMALALGLQQEADSIEASMAALKKGFNDVFWTGNAYRHPDYSGLTDDRVQGLAIVAGLVDPDKYDAIFQTIKESEHASPYMEKYVEEGLILMGQPEYALERMKKRFGLMVNDDYHTTLYEGWGEGWADFGGGTTNHAWSGGGLTLLSQYIAGISPVDPGYSTFKVSPQLAGLEYVKATVPTVKGDIRISAKESDGELSFTLTAPEGTTGIIDLPGYTITSDTPVALPGGEKHKVTAKKN